MYVLSPHVICVATVMCPPKPSQVLAVSAFGGSDRYGQDIPPIHPLLAPGPICHGCNILPYLHTRRTTYNNTNTTHPAAHHHLPVSSSFLLFFATRASTCLAHSHSHPRRQVCTAHVRGCGRPPPPRHNSDHTAAQALRPPLQVRRSHRTRGGTLGGCVVPPLQDTLAPASDETSSAPWVGAGVPRACTPPPGPRVLAPLLHSGVSGLAAPSCRGGASWTPSVRASPHAPAPWHVQRLRPPTRTAAGARCPLRVVEA